MLFGCPRPEINPKKPDACRQIATLILGILCFAGGLFGEQFIKFLFDVSVSVDAIGYLEKIFLFAISLAVGFLIYKFFVKNSRLLVRLRGFEIGFRGMCALMGIFFAVILIAGKLL